METTRWEYKRVTILFGGTPIEDIDDTAAADELDEYGRDGWELVAIGRDNFGGSVLTFKRPK